MVAHARALHPDNYEDSTLAYGDREIFDLLDEDNGCTDAGGHVWLAANGEARCLRCPAREPAP